MGPLFSTLSTTWRSWRRWMRKRVLRLLTRTGELERLLRRGPVTPAMARAVAAELRQSRQLRRAGLYSRIFPDADAAWATPDSDELTALATELVRVKRIVPSRPGFHSLLLPNLIECLRALRRNASIHAAARRLAAMPFDSANVQHELLLRTLWSSLQPDTPLPSRVGEHWQALGFQGRDPATDFRGGGVLSLHAFLHLSQRHATAARSILRQTDLPYRGYNLALVCIHTALWSLDLLRAGKLDLNQPLPPGPEEGHFGGGRDGRDRGAHPHDKEEEEGPSAADGHDDHVHGAAGGVEMLLLYDVVSHVVLLFDEHWWDSRPTSIMDFPRVNAAFRQAVLEHLERAAGQLPPLRSMRAPAALRSADDGRREAGGRLPASSSSASSEL
jgi:hypothetical protein